MKERSRKGESSGVTWSSFFWCTLLVVSSFILFSSLSFTFFRRPLRVPGTVQPELVTTWHNTALHAVSTEPDLPASETVVFPDQILVFLNYPSSGPRFTKHDIHCLYLPTTSLSSQPSIKLTPLYIDGDAHHQQIVRCSSQPRGYSVAVGLNSAGAHLAPGPTYRWDMLVYEAVIDRDNTMVVFVKGFNLKPARLSDPTRFECVYGWDFSTPKFLLRSTVISIGEEIVRCRTPLSVLSGTQKFNDSIKVSVRLKGRPTLPSVARPKYSPEFGPLGRTNGFYEYEMCACTMLRNQARFLREWIMYHARVGVQRWFIYDNNSDDDIEEVISELNDQNYNMTRHVWPWIKSQEAGFSHCALRARAHCKWVGFIDVDEFFHSPSGLSLHGVVQNQIELSPGPVGEIRVFCYSFGPSSHKEPPPRGVMVGYTCRMLAHERHKSIIHPDALSSNLINVVHHFYLKDGYRFVTLDRPVMVINHYKYQVWEVFKEKFYRRVATYVSDWQDEHNVGSKDRTPGLGTQAIEPPDWSTRFCEVNDTGLRSRVMDMFADPVKQILPWEKG